MQTKKVAFLGVVQVGVDNNTVDTFLTEAGIDGDDQFEQGGLKELEIAAIPLLQSLMAISSESEGGLSESRSLQGIKDRLLFLAKKHGLKDVIASIGGIPKISAYKWDN
ncbi:DUF6706 family protein [Parapedobacter indicus]|uniref:Uncharacterized protein n=1 Tax=Parapedobacter indicus TaxID=1477437 RepID=A0A1I3V2T4_9SPHI|nr:DUF6706 family protein [Parapedobacter indicus]PPK98978.1 hypothetical protein CLV26_1157 [Parapedobacter indicus]SFJ89748.1 hypothetical protein SAMN05444682_115170 [Parapedobacter indicus]